MRKHEAPPDPHTFYEVVEKRHGIIQPATQLLFERRIDAVLCARTLKKKGMRVKVRAIIGPDYRRR